MFVLFTFVLRLTADCGTSCAHYRHQPKPAAKAHGSDHGAVSLFGRPRDLDAVVVGLLAIGSISAAGGDLAHGELLGHVKIRCGNGCPTYPAVGPLPPRMHERECKLKFTLGQPSGKPSGWNRDQTHRTQIFWFWLAKWYPLPAL